MSTRAAGTFEITNWEQATVSEIDGGPTLARASVAESYRGDMEGEATVEQLMMSRADGFISFVRLARVVGRLADRSGSFVIQGSGTVEDGTVRATFIVVPGSGTEELHGLRGEGAFVAHHGEEPVEWACTTWQPQPMRFAAVILDYDFGS
jgi:hypothetical protein